MIFKLIIKNWKTILDVVLILALVILLFLWNPLNIFGSQRLRLQDTANMVGEIREIGELITAEYYGEVIASDEEAAIQLFDVDSIENRALDAYLNKIKKILFDSAIKNSQSAIEEVEAKKFLFDALRKKYLNNLLEKKRIATIDAVYLGLQQELTDDVLNALILFIGTYEHTDKVKISKFIRKNENGREAYVEKVLKEIIGVEYGRIVSYTEGDADFKNYLERGFTSNKRFTDFFYEYVEEQQPKKQQKVELAVIGRGSVKAGFRFDQLDERNVVYDENRKTIYLFGFNSEILHYDINPWFIPEQRVPGYQIIMANHVDFDKMKDVKIHTLEKLRNKAEGAGILRQAQENGEIAISEFFSLLLDTEIREVIFRNDNLAIEARWIMDDGLITPYEIHQIDSLISKQLTLIQEDEEAAITERRKKLLREFISGLEKCKITWKDQRFPYSYFNRHIPQLLQDGIIANYEGGEPLDQVLDRQELWWIEQMRIKPLKRQMDDDKAWDNQLPDDFMYWTEDSLQYYRLYNDFIERLVAVSGDPMGSLIRYTGKKEWILSEANQSEAEDLDALISADSTWYQKEDYFLYGDSAYYYQAIKYIDLNRFKYPLREGLYDDWDTLIVNNWYKGMWNDSIQNMWSDSVYKYFVNAPQLYYATPDTSNDRILLVKKGADILQLTGKDSIKNNAVKIGDRTYPMVASVRTALTQDAYVFAKTGSSSVIKADQEFTLILSQDSSGQRYLHRWDTVSSYAIKSGSLRDYIMDYEVIRSLKDATVHTIYFRRSTEDELMYDYLLWQKEQFEKADNSFKRFRRNIQSNMAISKSFDGIKHAMDSATYELRKRMK